MSGSFHLPTAIVVAGGMVLLYVLVRLLQHGRSGRRGFVSDVDEATYRTLHTASLAARHLQDGLTPEGTTRAARHLRGLLGSSALAVSDAGGLVAQDGLPDRHATQAPDHALEVLRSGLDPDVPERWRDLVADRLDAREKFIVFPFWAAGNAAFELALEDHLRRRPLPGWRIGTASGQAMGSFANDAELAAFHQALRAAYLRTYRWGEK